MINTLGRKYAKRPISTEKKLEKVVPDTSSVIHGKLTQLAEKGELDGAEVILPEIVMGELQGQASRGQETGFLGLAEIKKLREIAEKRNIKVSFVGERPSYEDIMLAKSGRIDALIQDEAKKQRATLLTCDLPQALAAEAEGAEVRYNEAYEKAGRTKLEDLLTEDTMSLHLKEGVVPVAKRGKPGHFKLVEIRADPMTAEEMAELEKSIMDATRYAEESFFEFGERGASVVQLKNMRIAITRPPFSDGLEITVVRPIVKLALDDYRLSEKLKERLGKHAEGILIAGPPGSGKSTFAASMAEFYLAQGKVVKTMESPRDLQVPNEITQFSPLAGSFAKTADILLLVRPDYTIFDEIRKTSDFNVFADMRLAGIGMIGVVHATQPVDAVQRFIGRIELGIIPHVVDTIVFIKAGKIEKVYRLALTVRVPQGMTEADLARPIVEVLDFETGMMEYEIYTYGEQTVVIPASAEKKTGVRKLAENQIKDAIRRFDSRATVDVVSDNKAIVKVANDAIPLIIGKEGKNIKKLEEELGISIDVEPAAANLGKQVDFELGEKGASVALFFNKHLSGKQASIYIENEYLFTATIGRRGDIKVGKDSDIGRQLIRAMAGKKEIKVFI
ncbi:MAG: PINc/VapC family ATPase [Candidatus Aenigmatarchaeota archaeon]